MRAIYERIRDSEGFRGGYSTVKDFVRTTPPVEDFSWEWAYDVLMSLEKRSAIDFLLLLSRADPPVVSLPRARQFFRDAGRVNRRAPKPDKRAEAQRNAFEWMRGVLQKGMDDNAVGREVGDLPDVKTLLHRLYTGRLSDRNRSMAVLANRRGLSSGTICRFLSINMRTCRAPTTFSEASNCKDPRYR